MEKNNNLSLKDHSVGSKSTRENYMSNKYYNNNNNPNYAENYMGHGYSWPPRSYSCSFCKREFKSAQALGGHMNVHRRDRARLRVESPPRDINLNFNPNPNPSFLTTHSPSTMLPSLVSPSLSSSSSASASHHEIKKSRVEEGVKSLFGVKEFDGTTQGRECHVLMEKAEFVGLELGIGLHSDFKEDVDLELRLGYS